MFKLLGQFLDLRLALLNDSCLLLQLLFILSFNLIFHSFCISSQFDLSLCSSPLCSRFQKHMGVTLAGLQVQKSYYLLVLHVNRLLDLQQHSCSSKKQQEFLHQTPSQFFIWQLVLDFASLRLPCTIERTPPQWLCKLHWWYSFEGVFSARPFCLGNTAAVRHLSQWLAWKCQSLAPRNGGRQESLSCQLSGLMKN